MVTTTYLFAANVAVWLGLAGYLALLGLRSLDIERRIGQLERLSDDQR